MTTLILIVGLLLIGFGFAAVDEQFTRKTVFCDCGRREAYDVLIIDAVDEKRMHDHLCQTCSLCSGLDEEAIYKLYVQGLNQSRAREEAVFNTPGGRRVRHAHQLSSPLVSEQSEPAVREEVRP